MHLCLQLDHGRRKRPASAVACASAIVLLLLAALAPESARAQSGRHASMVIDANTGQVLHAQLADEPRYPASLTKLMTLYIAFELIEQGRLSPAGRIKISEVAAATLPSKLGLQAGAEIPVMDAIKALITKSANDMAVALGEHIAGSEEKFAALMTKKARQLGMSATTFRNAHGLPDSGQVTTARDMLTLALRLNDDFPKYYRLFSLRAFTYNGSTYRNHNTMLDSYAGMDGLKTGYTTPSGFNLVASVRRQGKHVVAVVFGGSTASARNILMRSILDRSLPKASTEKTRSPASVAKLVRQPEPAKRRPDAPVVTRPLVEAARPAIRPRPATTAEPSSLPVKLQPADAAAPASSPQVAAPIELSAPEVERAPVSIAKVRPLMLTPRAKAAEPAPAMAAAGEVPKVPAVAMPPDSSGSAPAEAAVVAPPVAPSPGTRLAAFSQPPGTFAAIARGNAPSSLQAQANRLARGEQPVVAPPSDSARPPLVAAASGVAGPAMHLVGPQKAGTAAKAGAGDVVVLQVGAYATEDEAKRKLQAAIGLTGSLLGRAIPSVLPASANGKTTYQARFVGIDAASAASACTELRRQQIDCRVSKGQ